MSSSFGQVFRISTWGESHGAGVGVVIDGCPSLVPVTEEAIQRELDRRRPGQSDIVTPRKEEDRAEILSGVLDGKTLGTPIAVSVRNKDHRSSAYDEMAHTYRPSHADYTYDAKYGIRAWAGGGRASARKPSARRRRGRGQGRAQAGLSRHGDHSLGGPGASCESLRGLGGRHGLRH